MYGLLPLACRGWCSARSSGSPSRRAASPASPRNPAQPQQETDQTLRPAAIHAEGKHKSQFRVVRGGEGESRPYMRVVLAPGLALLGEATASDSPRHVCCGFSSPSDRLASGWGVLGLDFSAIARMMCRCARSYLTTPVSPFSFVFYCIFFTFFIFSGKWAPGGR